MEEIKYSIKFIFLFLLSFIIINFFTNNSIFNVSQKRNLSERRIKNLQEKEQNQQFSEEHKQDINYKIYLEMQKLEEEEDKRKLAKAKELIKQNIERWEKKSKAYLKKDKLIIPCAYALDNSYIFPTLVSMTSLVENAGNNTFYSIYVLIDSGFSEENKIILKSVEKNHINHCEIIFLLMSDKYKNEKTDKRIKTPAYYRLDLPIIVPNVSKIIWLDGDTGVFEDLSELINLDMKGNYIMGFLDSIPEAIDKFGIINSTVLCTGVLLMDLEALRKNNMTEKFEKFMIEQRENINQHDQTIINVVCQGKIAPLPPKYGIWCFEARIHALKHNRRQRLHLQYNETEFLHAYYHPAILHYVWPKPYWRRKKPVFNNEWWNYARKSGYYNDIYTKSPKFVKWLRL